MDHATKIKAKKRETFYWFRIRSHYLCISSNVAKCLCTKNCDWTVSLRWYDEPIRSVQQLVGFQHQSTLVCKHTRRIRRGQVPWIGKEVDCQTFWQGLGLVQLNFKNGNVQLFIHFSIRGRLQSCWTIFSSIHEQSLDWQLHLCTRLCSRCIWGQTLYG